MCGASFIGEVVLSQIVGFLYAAANEKAVSFMDIIAEQLQCLSFPSAPQQSEPDLIKMKIS